MINDRIISLTIICSTILTCYKNQIIFNQANPFPPEIANATRDFVVEFNEVVSKKTKSRKQGARQELIQTSHTHVISVDAGCFSDSYIASGCMFNDYIGVTTFSACKKEQMTAEPTIAEAPGIRWCM